MKLNENQLRRVVNSALSEVLRKKNKRLAESRRARTSKKISRVQIHRIVNEELRKVLKESNSAAAVEVFQQAYEILKGENWDPNDPGTSEFNETINYWVNSQGVPIIAWEQSEIYYRVIYNPATNSAEYVSEYDGEEIEYEPDPLPQTGEELVGFLI